MAVIYGLTQIAQDGVGWLPALSVIAGLALGVAFVRRQQSLIDPLIDVRLFRVPAFSASLASNTLNVFVSFGTFVVVAQYLQLVRGLSPLQAGLWSLPSSCGAVAGSLLAPLLMRRMRAACAVAALLAVAAVGFGLLTQADGTAGLALIVTGWTLWALGGAAALTVTTGLIVGTASPERAGAASAMAQTFADLGGALGIAILAASAPPCIAATSPRPSQRGFHARRRQRPRTPSPPP